VFTDLVDQFEPALCELVEANREQITAALRDGHTTGAPIAAIAFGVFPWYESIELSFGSKQDYLERTSEQGEWTHYSICNSQSSPTDRVVRAVAGMEQFYMADEDEEEEYEEDDEDEHGEDDEEESVSLIRANVIFFAAAKALMSPKFWHVLNPIHLSVLEELVAEGRATGLTDFLLRDIGEDDPSLHCVVTDGDATVRGNYCEMLKAVDLLGEHTDEVLTAFLRN